MTLRPVTPPQLPAEARRAQIDRQVTVQDGVTTLKYFLTFNGAGEASVDVNFPCRFIDVPTIGGGFHMAPGSVLTAKNYPWCGVPGAIFVTEERGGKTYYIGATVILVMGGTRRQKMTVHVTFEAKAIVGPVN